MVLFTSMTFVRRMISSSIEAIVPLLRGSFWSLFSQIIAKLCMLAMSLIAARSLGVAGFGWFASLQAISLLSVAVWDLGFSPMITREVAAGRRDLMALIRSALTARLWLLPGWIILYVGGCEILGVRPGEQLVAAIIIAVGGLISGLSSLLNAGLQGQLRFRASAMSLAVGRTISTLISITTVIMMGTFHLTGFAVAFLIGEIVILWTESKILRSEIRGPLIQLQPKIALDDLRHAVPYALNGMFTLIYNRLDVFLVFAFAGSFQAGIFAPASRAQDALMLMPVTASAAVMPVASKRFGENNNPGALRNTGIAALAMSLGLTLPVIVVMFFGAHRILPQLLGESYQDSIGVFKVAIWSLVFIAVAQPFFSLIVAAGKAKQLNVAYGAGLITALLGHALFDPVFGALAGAWVAVARDAVACLVGCAIAWSWFRASPTSAKCDPKAPCTSITPPQIAAEDSYS